MFLWSNHLGRSTILIGGGGAGGSNDVSYAYVVLN
jgi:hypothetical protein